MLCLTTSGDIVDHTATPLQLVASDGIFIHTAKQRSAVFMRTKRKETIQMKPEFGST